jgi:hypothetical protein
MVLVDPLVGLTKVCDESIAYAAVETLLFVPSSFSPFH